MKPTVTEILDQMVRLLHEKFRVPYSSLKESYWDEPITGLGIDLSGVELVYLFFEMEKFFQVRIDHQQLMSYGFCSIRQIARAIEKAIEFEKPSHINRLIANKNEFVG